jgi:hypothetical protein
MTTKDFIDQAIGEMVYVTGDRDLAFDGGLRKIIFNKTELRLLKWTKGGKVYLHNETENIYYTVPPSNIRESRELN